LDRYSAESLREISEIASSPGRMRAMPTDTDTLNCSSLVLRCRNFMALARRRMV
jgi:hypothetical protein